MKDIEDEIPFAVPDGWSWCRLKEISLDMADGPFGSNLKTEHYTTKKEARLIQLSNIGEEGWREENTKYTTFEHAKKNISRSIVESGNIVIAKMMPAGRAIICPNNEKMYVLSSDAVKLIPSILIYSKYLLNTINSPSFRNSVTDNVQGSTRLRTSISKLKECFIPLPPLNEQQLIVTEIEKIFAQIDLLEQNKIDLQTTIKQAKSKILDLAIHGKLVSQDPNDESAEELLKRIATSDNRPYKKFEEAVLFEIPKSWSWCYLHTISALLNGDRGENYPSKKDYVECGIPFINAGCLDNGNINYDVANYITEEKYNSLRAGKIQKGDILYCLRGSLGKTGFVITDNKGAISSSLCIFRLNESVIPQYFLYVLNSNAIKVQQKMVDNGTAQPNLSAKDVSNYQIPLPPLAEQYRIVTKIEELFEKLDIISN